jgi:hypothetical protein
MVWKVMNYREDLFFFFFEGKIFPYESTLLIPFLMGPIFHSRVPDME